MSEVWINDIDLADYGFVMGTDPAHGDSPDFTDATAALLGAIGPTWEGEPTQAAVRTIPIAGSCKAASSAQLRAFADYLKSLASTGAVRIRLADRLDQEFRDGRLTSFKVASKGAILTNLAGMFTLTFGFADPLRYDVNPQGFGLSTQRVPLLIGTAPTFPVLYLHGGGASLTNPSVTIRTAAGDPVQTMGFTGVLGANDFLIVDCRRTIVTKSVASVQSAADSWWNAALGDFLVVRPADGWYEFTQYPTIEFGLAAGGSGTPFGQIIYNRGWL